MKINIHITVSESGTVYSNPETEISKNIIIDVPGSDFESLNLPNYIQTTIEKSLQEFKQLPLPEPTVEEDENPF